MNKRILLVFCLIMGNVSLWAQFPYNTDFTASHFSNPSIVIASSEASWDGGVWLTNGGFDWTERYIVVALDQGGIPDKLTFTCKQNSVFSTRDGFKVYQSATNGNWSVVSEPGLSGTSEKPYTVTLAKTTKYLKFGWSGNFKGYYTKINVSELKYVTPSASIVDCGTLDVLQSSNDTQFSIDWCNVKPLTLSLDNTTDFALGTASIASSTGAYGTASNIIVDFHPQTKGAKTATVTVSDSDNQTWATITLTGQSNALSQSIVWWDEETTMLSRGDIIGSNESPFVFASSDLPLTSLTSSDENVLRIEGGRLIAVAAGTADIIAYQAGSPTVDEVRDTLHLEVTNLLTQKITWTQPLSFLLGAAQTELTAVASSGLPITYELVNNANNIVTLVGNMLTISTTNVGTATIKATQAGNETYAATSYLRTLRVRDPNVSCINEPLALEDNNEYSLSTIQTGPEFVLNGYPAVLTFEARKSTLGINYFYVQQYIGSSWSDVANPSLGSNYATYTYNLNRNATKIRFLTRTGATFKKYYKNIRVTRAHFIESNPTTMVINGQFGTTTKKTVQLTYSNVQDEIQLNIIGNNPDFHVEPALISVECGDYGTKNIFVSYTPSAIEPDTVTLNVSSVKDGWNLNIPITTTVEKRAQYISWALRDSLASTQTYTLNKINPVSGLPITYNFSDETILKLDADNKLVFLQVDTVVTITASCAGNDYYLDAENIVKTIRLFKGLPTLTLPVAADTIYFGQILGLVRLEGGCAKDMSDDLVAGSFVWENYLAVPNAGNPVSCAIKFVPERRDIYGEVFDFVDVVVLKLPQFIEWSMPDSLGILDSITLDAQVASGLKISYQLSGEGAAYASIGSDNELNLIATVEALGKELTITAWQVGNHNYLPSDTVVYTVIIRKTIAEFFAATEPTIYGKNLEDIPIYVDHNVAGTWQYDDTSNPILDVCIYSLSATFTPSNLELCEPSHVEIPVNIIAIPTTIAVAPTAQSIEQGKSLGEATLVGGSVVVAGTTDVVAGTFAWQNPNFIPAIGDNQEFTVVFTPNSTNYAVVTCTVTLNVTQ